jgi:uncharacterized protein (TIGR02598 family)
VERAIFGRFTGFSLVEVMIAIGIVAFALTAMLGVLPAGFDAMNQSAAQTTQAHILRQVAGDLAKIDSDLSSYLAESQYYDLDGRRVNPGDESVIYTATLALLPPVYPGVGASGVTGIDRRLGRIVVTIRKPGDTAARGFKAFVPVFNYGVIQ